MLFFQHCFVSQRYLDLVVIKLTGFIHCDVQTSQSGARQLRQGLLNLPEGPLKGEQGGGGEEGQLKWPFFVKASVFSLPPSMRSMEVSYFFSQVDK